MRDKLIELMERAINGSCQVEDVTDYLLENSVIVPPCKVGQTVYVIWFSDDTNGYKMAAHKVMDISTKYIWLDENDFYYPLTAIGEEIFFTKEEAEMALKGGAE